jgi:hypothetical protein
MEPIDLPIIAAKDIPRKGFFPGLVEKLERLVFGDNISAPPATVTEVPAPVSAAPAAPAAPVVTPATATAVVHPEDAVSAPSPIVPVAPAAPAPSAAPATTPAE